VQPLAQHREAAAGPDEARPESEGLGLEVAKRRPSAAVARQLAIVVAAQAKRERFGEKLIGHEVQVKFRARSVVGVRVFGVEHHPRGDRHFGSGVGVGFANLKLTP